MLTKYHYIYHGNKIQIDMKEKKNERRAFLGKMALGLSSVVALPFLFSSKTKDEDNMEEVHPVKKIKALGFQWETADPFLFCVHHEDKYPKGNDAMGPDASLEGRSLGQDFIIKDGWRMYHGGTVPGFPGHPHRGFETITVVREGIVDHADSTGASGRYGNGDVQWMTAGKGVQHSEMFPLVSKEKENPMELFQIWLNLPKKSKMVEPHFAMLWNDTIPVIEEKDLDGKLSATIEIIAGTLKEENAPAPPPDSWANEKVNHVGIFNIKLEANSTFELEASVEGVNRTIYYYEGKDLKIQDLDIPFYHAAEVDPTKNLVIKNGDTVSKILVLQGMPIAEPVVQHGPFVMNTREEIQQAFEDYHATQYGGWPWEKYDMVHAREKKRFAKHADGMVELKEG